MERSDRYQEKLKLDFGKTLLELGIKRFDFGKMFFSHQAKAFVFWHMMTLGKFRLWEKRLAPWENGRANGFAPWETRGKFPTFQHSQGAVQVLTIRLALRFD